MDKLLVSSEVAHLLGVTPARVRQLARAGTLKPVGTLGIGVRLFRRKDVEALQRSRRSTTHHARAR